MPGAWITGFVKLTGASFLHTKASGASLSSSGLVVAWFSSSGWAAAWHSSISFLEEPGVSLAGASLSSSELEPEPLSGASLSKAGCSNSHSRSISVFTSETINYTIHKGLVQACKKTTTNEHFLTKSCPFWLLDGSHSVQTWLLMQHHSMQVLTVSMLLKPHSVLMLKSLKHQ